PVFVDHYSLGCYGGEIGEGVRAEGLASMVFKAWISATRLEEMKYRRLVYFPYQGCYHLIRSGPFFKKNCELVIQRALYLAKERSKSNEDGWRNFGCSQN
ncbi:YagK/YfjJ domain-containing protein, partial [Pectobacterium versatile]|uniref:YagK/YfjJ domain-containing protein n=1 Tax=Pectobacterium versatile TaxID=2488639 RepID=UPI001F313119